MNEDQAKKLLNDIAEMKLDTKHIKNQVQIIDKRLSLIEQRLTNIEPWVSVDNKNLQYDSSSSEMA